MAHVGDTCPKYKKGKTISFGRDISKNQIFWKRYRERERGGEGGKNPLAISRVSSVGSR